MAMSWGDVSTAFYSTGIPDIEVYFIVSGAMPRLLQASRLVSPLLRWGPIQRFMKSRIDAMPEGPGDEERETGRALLLAEVEGPGGQLARSLLETPSGYALTWRSAVEIAERTLRGELPVGFQTPSSALGADFVLELAFASDGTDRPVVVAVPR